MSLSALAVPEQRSAAYELLAPIYHWFTEGFDTADLQEAGALHGGIRVKKRRARSRLGARGPAGRGWHNALP